MIRELTWVLGMAVCLTAAGEAAPEVDEEAVGEVEYRWFEEEERTGVIQHFQSKHGVEFGPEFWDREVEGGTPREMLRERTLERVRRERVERRLFADLGLIRDGSFEEFLRSYERTNREREAAQRAGKVIFGPVKFTQLQYYGYWKSNLRIEAIHKLGGERWAGEDKGLWERRYQELVEELVRDADRKSEKAKPVTREPADPET